MGVVPFRIWVPEECLRVSLPALFGTKGWVGREGIEWERLGDWEHLAC